MTKAMTKSSCELKLLAKKKYEQNVQDNDEGCLEIVDDIDKKLFNSW